MSLVHAEHSTLERTLAPLAVVPDCAPEATPRGQPPLDAASRWQQLKTPVSLWLLFHISAVFLYPAAIPAPPGSLLSTISDAFFERYMEALYMVQGHRFFAPEPGPGTLIAYRIERADGSIEENLFPRRDIKPRLMYHRHFMLSERSQDVGAEREWFRMYARHLAHELDGERVTLWRVVHYLPTPQELLSGKQLTDQEFYDRQELGQWSRAELDEAWNIDNELLDEPVAAELADDEEIQP